MFLTYFSYLSPCRYSSSSDVKLSIFASLVLLLFQSLQVFVELCTLGNTVRCFRRVILWEVNSRYVVLLSLVYTKLVLKPFHARELWVHAALVVLTLSLCGRQSGGVGPVEARMCPPLLERHRCKDFYKTMPYGARLWQRVPCVAIRFQNHQGVCLQHVNWQRCR